MSFLEPRAWRTLALALGLVGCGGSSKTSAATSGDATMGTGGSTATGGAGPGGGATGGGGSAGGDAAHAGILDFISQAKSTDTFVGLFANSALHDFFGPCDGIQSYGSSCVAATCPSAANTKTLSAGKLTLTGGIYQTGLEIAENGAGVYGYQEAAEGPSFAAGDVLGVSATGAAVPAFSESIVAPSCMTLTAPTANQGEFTLSESEDLDVAWSGGTAGEKVFVQGGTLDTDTNVAHQFVCRFDASSGHGVVPHAAIAAIESSAANMQTVLAWGQYQEKNFVAGDFAIELLASCQEGSSAHLTP